MNAIIDNMYIGESDIKMMFRNGDMIYRRITGTVPEPDYFRITAFETGDLDVHDASGASYSINDGSWQPITTSEVSIPVNESDVVRFKGNLNNTDYMFSGNTLDFDVMGNIMTLKYGNNVRGQTTAFSSQYMFSDCTNLHYANQLLLPATTLVSGCYAQMFRNCGSLQGAPALPATTLAERCYYYMFYKCSVLVQAPYLPATTLASECYAVMFYNCSALTQTQAVLPATTLAYRCYYAMYQGTPIVNAPALPATTLAEGCYQYMFHNCLQLQVAPDLPAPTLVPYCYYWMFYISQRVNYIKCLATDISASSCTTGWVGGVGLTGTFVKHPNATWPRGTSGIPGSWTVMNNNE